MSIITISAHTHIESARLSLVPLTIAHSRELFADFVDPKLYTWISMRPPIAPNDLARRWWCCGDNGPGRVDGYVNLDWAVVRKRDGLLIGKLDAELLPEGIVSNLGYMIAPQYWNEGYGTESVGLLVEALENSGFTEQRAYVTDGNMASMRLLYKIGFRRIRLLVGNDTIRGELVDDVEFIRKASPVMVGQR